MITHLAYSSRCILSQQQGNLGDNSVCIQNLEASGIVRIVTTGCEGECRAKNGVVG